MVPTWRPERDLPMSHSVHMYFARIANQVCEIGELGQILCDDKLVGERADHWNERQLNATCGSRIRNGEGCEGHPTYDALQMLNERNQL